MAIQLDGIRTIVFDLDDTLYAERDFAYSGFDAVGRWLKERMACPVDPATRMRQLFETGNRRRVFDELLLELRCPDVGRMVPAMIECYRNHFPVIKLMPDAERALARWSGSFFLGLISDGPLRTQQQKVQALDLERRLNRVILTDEWGPAYWKPHPRAFEIMERESGQSGSACVYIADNPAKDFVAPNSLGWRTVRIRRPGGVYADMSPPPGGCEQFQVQSLDEVDIRF